MADIGYEYVIGAGSVVTREIADLSITAGNPARVIQQRTDLAKGPRGWVLDENTTRVCS